MYNVYCSVTWRFGTFFSRVVITSNQNKNNNKGLYNSTDKELHVRVHVPLYLEKQVTSMIYDVNLGLKSCTYMNQCATVH